MSTSIISRCVMITLDSSENSERAFDWMMDNFYRDGDKILITHVHQLPNLPVGGLYGGAAALTALSDGYQTALHDSVQASRKCAATFKLKCDNKKIPNHVLLQTSDGTIGETICKLAHGHDVAAIVIGSRGLGTFRRTFLGSVSDYVLHHSHVPTIVIPPITAAVTSKTN